ERRRRHTRFSRDWSSDVCSSDLIAQLEENQGPEKQPRLETYPAPRTNPAEVTSTLQMVAPAAQLRINSETQQLQVWATPRDQQRSEERRVGKEPRDSRQPYQQEN